MDQPAGFRRNGNCKKFIAFGFARAGGNIIDHELLDAILGNSRRARRRLVEIIIEFHRDRVNSLRWHRGWRMGRCLILRGADHR